MSDAGEDAELLTVVEAARRLGIDPRQVRRYADRLTGQDRTPAGLSPLRVRLSAVEALRIEAAPDGRRKQDTGQDKTGPQGRTPGGTGQDTPGGGADGRGALIEQLRQENERLNAALERAQGALSQALTALAGEQHRTRQLEETQARLIGLLPPPAPEAPSDAQHTGAKGQDRPQETVGGPETGAVGEDGAKVAQEAAEGKQAGFWARLLGREKRGDGMELQITGAGTADGEGADHAGLLAAIRADKGIALGFTVDEEMFAALSDVIRNGKQEQEDNNDPRCPDVFAIETKINAAQAIVTPYTGHPAQGGQPVPEKAGVIGQGEIRFSTKVPAVFVASDGDPTFVLGLLMRQSPSQHVFLKLGTADNWTMRTEEEAAEWAEFCQELIARNSRLGWRFAPSDQTQPTKPLPAVDAVAVPATTPIPRAMKQQTGQLVRTLNAAIGDGPSGRRWQPLDGQIGLRHTIEKWPMQTLLLPGQALSWWGLPESIESLRGELGQMGIEGVFLANVLMGLSLQEGQVTIAQDELIRHIGRGDEARKNRQSREKVEREVWRAILLFDAIAVGGRMIGRYTARDTKEVLDVRLPGMEAVIKITGVTPGQTSSDGSAAPAFFSYVCGPWITSVKDNRQILTDFGDVMRLARIPGGQPSNAWAKSIGLNLNQRWREWGHEAKVSRPGDGNRLAVQFKKSFTRRDLLIGEDLYRATPDAQQILDSDTPGRAKQYWDQAIGILKSEVRLISHYRELSEMPAGRKGWQNTWLDQPLDIRPSRDGAESVALLAQGTRDAKRARRGLAARKKSATN